MSRHLHLIYIEHMETNAKFQDETIAPMHTAEHILNQTMVRLFDCGRAVQAHIERKKSKLDFLLDVPPTNEQIDRISKMVNDVIEADMPVKAQITSIDNLPQSVSLDRLPDRNVKEVRLVFVGDYDVCPCIGIHVATTSALGFFRITSTSYSDGRFRIVFKLNLPS